VKRVTILGARSFVCAPLLSELKDYSVTVVSREPETLKETLKANHYLHLDDLLSNQHKTEHLISLMPIWVTAQILERLDLKALNVTAISSSSIINKRNSKSAADQALVSKLSQAEQSLKTHCETKKIMLCILRPTMVFGHGKDLNVSFILKQLKRTRIMPLIGKASGLRQPLYVEDLAKAITAALQLDKNTTLALGGASQISYKQMIHDIARASNLMYLPIRVPRFVVQLALNAIRLLEKYEFLEMEMFDRMNQDLVVSNEDAKKAFSFTPLHFIDALAKDLDA